MTDTKTSPPTPDELHQQIAELPFRTPVVDDYDQMVHDKRDGEDWKVVANRAEAEKSQREEREAGIDHQWLMATEAARRAILSNPQAREVVRAYVTTPIDETIPSQVMDALAETNPLVSRTLRLSKAGLGALLGLEPVPRELLKPDITNAPSLQTAQYTEEILGSWLDMPDFLEENPEYLAEQLQDTADRIEKHPGVTDAEKRLAARRYRYARDVKMLALMSELVDQPGEESITDGLMTRTLPSGTELVITEEAYEKAPDLLNPAAWERRIQLKDRVYTVTVGGSDYLLKEKKTSYHTDTKEHGHIDGNNSKDEFAIARQFAELGTITEGDIQLHWERPLGYVEYPDGFQFCMFELEPGLIAEPEGTLWRAIVAHPEAYQEEFEAVQTRAKNLLAERSDLIQGRRIDDEEGYYDSQLRPDQPKARDELTFQEFAQLKAHYMTVAAGKFLERTLLEQGVVNGDVDGHAFRVRDDDSARIVLEVVGFDFEYYKQDPDQVEKIRQRDEENRADGDQTKHWARRGHEAREVVTAASYAMMEDMGWVLPSQR